MRAQAVLLALSLAIGGATSAEAKRGFSFKGLGSGSTAKSAPVARPAVAPAPPRPAPATAAKPPTPVTAPAAPPPAAAAAAPAAAAPVTQSRSIVVIGGRPRQTSGETEEQRQKREAAHKESPLTASPDGANRGGLIEPAAYRGPAEASSAAPRGFQILN
ncbi:MAG: hypothetical protein ACRCYS_03715 [Beijerinckiaceae bacterium]